MVRGQGGGVAHRAPLELRQASEFLQILRLLQRFSDELDATLAVLLPHDARARSTAEPKAAREGRFASCAHKKGPGRYTSY